MTLLGVLAAGTFTAFVYGQRLTASSRDQSRDLQLAQEILEQLHYAQNQTGQWPASGTPQLSLNTTSTGKETYTSKQPADTGETHMAGLAKGLKTGIVRKYTVTNGRYESDGSITWSDPSQGITIDDDHADIKKVEITVTR